MQRGLGGVLVLALFGFAGRAEARETFPGKVRDAQHMECTPGCGLCHVDPNGGGERNEWGKFRGPAATTPGGLATLMPPDFDHDGKDDAAELAAGENPGVYGPSSVCIPEYGCGARLARAPAPPAPFSWALAAGLFLFSLRRRTRAS